MFITAIALTSLSSCSKDDSKNNPAQPTNFLTAIINGVTLNFDTLKVVKEVVPNDGDPYTDLIVTATKSDDHSKSIIFNLQHLQVGTETCYYFDYTDGDINYDSAIGNSFEVNITVNTPNKLKGNITGRLSDSSNTNSIVIPSGSFDITY
ncbi:hypothetical protein DB895_00965 [Flavobacterium psychrotolerans]|uniref:Uncharacterized protein n=2 Tax=Flavobacterium psychrotolerans TaxID=2169410 RepID=A0A2U1JQS4_9FLAO|nr:hypothetical protein DB895_00965 [Flavobacterium psychrotolerans]